jgi:hypothetical protein
MNAHYFASAVGRWVAPAVLAASTFCGTLGFSSVASAQERVRVGVGAPHAVMAGPRVAVEGPRAVIGGPRVVVREPVVAPYYYGYGAPVWNAGYYGPAWGRGGYYGRPGYGYGERGWGRGGGEVHGGGGRGGAVHGGGGHGGGGRR